MVCAWVVLCGSHGQALVVLILSCKMNLIWTKKSPLHSLNLVSRSLTNSNITFVISVNCIEFLEIFQYCKEIMEKEEIVKRKSNSKKDLLPKLSLKNEWRLTKQALVRKSHSYSTKTIMYDFHD